MNICPVVAEMKLCQTLYEHTVRQMDIVTHGLTVYRTQLDPTLCGHILGKISTYQLETYVGLAFYVYLKSWWGGRIIAPINK